MRITIIGWYGTETIGDRAILSGILAILCKNYDDITVKLGSLFPFFTERTIKEDSNLWEKICKKNLEITLFDSKQPRQLRNAISNSDILIMGGGPLMHIPELHMVDYAFKRAKNHKKKTIIGGCGIGPIFNKSYHNTLSQILNNSDVIYLRDKKSIENLTTIPNGEKLLATKNIIQSFDPAIIPCLYYKENSKIDITKKIVLNLREFPFSYGNVKFNIDDILVNFINSIQEQNGAEINLVPMHYCGLGGDDREYFYKILSQNHDKIRVKIQAKPLNLEETFKVFANAKWAIGMRYHSVFFQTLLNGNNYIIDYTEPLKGKISGFIKDIDHSDFYKNRYINLQESEMIEFEFSNERFQHDLVLSEILENNFSDFK